MFYASEAASTNWPGEPESDPTSEEPVNVQGHQLDPLKCMDVAFRQVKKDPAVEGGTFGLLDSSLYSLRLGF